MAAACPVLVFEVLRQWGALGGSEGGRGEDPASGATAENITNPVKPRTKPKWEEDVGGF